MILDTYQKVYEAVYKIHIERYAEDYKKSVTHYKQILTELGFYQDGYDMYGSRVYSNGFVHVAVYYDRGERCWFIEEAQGKSNHTDNFYNTTSDEPYGCNGITIITDTECDI